MSEERKKVFIGFGMTLLLVIGVATLYYTITYTKEKGIQLACEKGWIECDCVEWKIEEDCIDILSVMGSEIKSEWTCDWEEVDKECIKYKRKG